MELTGKNVLITGAAAGIGAATARALAARGARLALVGLDPQGLAALAAELSGDGHVWAEADVTDLAAVRAAVDSATAEMGGLDVVVANAGIASFGTVRAYDPAAFARTVEVNLIGVFHTAQATLPHLVASRGYLLLVSSLAAVVPCAGFAAYGASKAGVEALAEALRFEVVPFGVAIGCAYMSWIDTDMVRDAEQDLSAFRAMRTSLPWPLNTVRPVAECAAAFARAIERRSRRVHVPAIVGAYRWLRPLVQTRLAQSVFAKQLAPRVATLEAEVRQLGRSVSERVRRSQPISRR